MRKIKSYFFISLDGVVESPDKWHFRYFDDEMGAAVGAGFATTGALLMGRVLYDEWAAYWPEHADEPFGDDRAPLGQVVVQVLTNRAVPVDFIGPRTGGARGFVQGAADRLGHRVAKLPLEILDHFPHHVPGGFLRLVRNDILERKQCADELNVGLDILERLGLQQHLLQIEPRELAG